MWGVYLTDGERHVMPIDDLLSHSESAKCWCGPTPDNGIFVHHSMDEREATEKE